MVSGGKRQAVIFPGEQKILQQLGENIRLAMRRRKITQSMIAERTGLSKPTLRNIERGAATVSIGHYLRVLAVLGLAEDLAAVAADDELGRKLQDIELLHNRAGNKIGTPPEQLSDEDIEAVQENTGSERTRRIESLMALVKSRSKATAVSGDDRPAPATITSSKDEHE